MVTGNPHQDGQNGYWYTGMECTRESVERVKRVEDVEHVEH